MQQDLYVHSEHNNNSSATDGLICPLVPNSSAGGSVPQILVVITLNVLLSPEGHFQNDQQFHARHFTWKINQYRINNDLNLNDHSGY